MASMNTENHSTQTGGEQSVFASLGLHTDIFLFQLINFTLVFLVIWFLILKPLTKKMEERKNIIDESLDKVKQVETNLMMSEQKYKEKIDEAKKEANAILEKAHEESILVAEKMKETTRQEIDALVVQAKKSISIEREEALLSVKNHAVDLIVSALTKVVGSEMSDKTDKKVIEDALKSMK